MGNCAVWADGMDEKEFDVDKIGSKEDTCDPDRKGDRWKLLLREKDEHEEEPSQSKHCNRYTEYLAVGARKDGDTIKGA